MFKIFLYLTACIIGALLVLSCIKAYTHTRKAGRILLILGIASSVVNFFSGIYYFIPYCLLLDNFELFAPLSDSFINPYSILFSASAYKENMTFLYIATAPFMLAFLFRAAAMMFPARQMSGAAAPAEFAIETLPEESRPAEPVPEESRPAEPVPVEPYLTKPNKGIYIMHEHYMEYLPVVPPVEPRRPMKPKTKLAICLFLLATFAFVRYNDLLYTSHNVPVTVQDYSMALKADGSLWEVYPDDAQAIKIAGSVKKVSASGDGTDNTYWIIKTDGSLWAGEIILMVS